MRKIVILLLAIVALCALGIAQAIAQETIQEAGQKAQEIHKVASSDIIHTEQELKALYYQNIQIIELLKDIRELLKQQLQHEK